MKMAKANKADLDMACDLAAALDTLGHRFLPAMPEAIEQVEQGRESEHFDRDDDKQCGRALRHLLDIVDRGSLFRVAMGLCVVLDPRNKCVDPAADTIEHHPERAEMLTTLQHIAGGAMDITVERRGLRDAALACISKVSGPQGVAA